MRNFYRRRVPGEIQDADTRRKKNVFIKKLCANFTGVSQYPLLLLNSVTVFTQFSVKRGHGPGHFVIRLV